MKIDSGLSGYSYPQRTVELERKQEEAPQREVASFSPMPGALTGSSTLLSNALAKALWAVEIGDAGLASSQTAPVQQDWVKNVYEEFG